MKQITDNKGYFKKSGLIFGFLLLLVFTLISCKPITIVPEEGYKWPEKQRDYWPTNGWKTAAMQDHNISSIRMVKADDFAKQDSLTRALLMVKDGYLVFEKYYGDGAVDKSSNLWSVAKSFISAVVGVVYDQNLFNSVNQKMKELLPAYPEFGEITLHQILTHTTGLDWSETGTPWINWVFSEDWVAKALTNRRLHEPGKVFLYSSANSQFLSQLIFSLSGKTPGILAKEKIFDPLGIKFELLFDSITYSAWEEYKTALPFSWRQDPKGIETGGFGLYLTARDMAKFGYLFLNRGIWNNKRIISESWIEESTKDQVKDVYDRYSYGYHWWITKVGGYPCFLASGFGGQIIGVVPSLDLVVIIKYEAEEPVHPKSGTEHDDMHLFELVVESVERK